MFPSRKTDFASAATNVSTLTVLQAFTQIGGIDAGDVLVSLLNLDGVNPVYLRVEFSHDGTRPDIDSPPDVGPIPAAQAGSVRLDSSLHAKYVRVSAYTQTPGFPVVAVKWLLEVAPR